MAKAKAGPKPANWAAIKGTATKQRRAAVRQMAREGAEVSNKGMRGKGARDQMRSYRRITDKYGNRVKIEDAFTKRGKVRGGMNMMSQRDKTSGARQTVTTYSEEG